jgi:hypothetical protein
LGGLAGAGTAGFTGIWGSGGIVAGAVAGVVSAGGVVGAGGAASVPVVGGACTGALGSARGASVAGALLELCLAQAC